MKEIKVQYEDSGWHRVVTDGEPGEWEMYESPAFSRDLSVMHLTDYSGEKLFTGLVLNNFKGIPIEQISGTFPDAYVHFISPDGTDQGWITREEAEALWEKTQRS